MPASSSPPATTAATTAGRCSICSTGCCDPGPGWEAWTLNTDVEAITAGTPALIVSPEGGPVGFYSNWWNGGHYGPPAWETFHLAELRPLLERALRANGRRAVAGLSMGGFGALSYAARHPGLFRAAASFSGVIHTTLDPAGVQGILTGQGVDPTALWGDPAAQPALWDDPHPTPSSPGSPAAIRSTWPAATAPPAPSTLRTAPGHPGARPRGDGPARRAPCPRPRSGRHRPSLRPRHPHLATGSANSPAPCPSSPPRSPDAGVCYGRKQPDETRGAAALFMTSTLTPSLWGTQRKSLTSGGF
ncbi:hypothetical protein SANTM175S_03441 [Streptomyces antimycoticus]